MLFNSRYAVAGAVNGLVGLTTIWGLTALGIHPVLANLLGYALALSVGFLGARTFVFRSKGQLTPEALRYLIAFGICYLINLATLYACISHFSLNALLSQGVAVVSYVITMYIGSRLFVFRWKQIDGNQKRNSS